MQRGEEQQLLVGQRPQVTVLVRPVNHRVQRAAALPDLELGHVAPADCPDAIVVHHHFPDGPTVNQQTLHVPREKAVNAHLTVAAGDGPQEIVQPGLGLCVPALSHKAAGQPDQLADGGIQHGNRLPQLPINLLLAGAQRHKPLQGPEGIFAAIPKLAGQCGGACRLFSFQFHASS